MTVSMLSAALLLLGLLCWLLVPVLERRHGNAGATSALAVGAALLGLTVLSGFWGGARAALFAILALAWAGAVYARFRAAQGGVTPPADAASAANCVPKLILGSYTRLGSNQETWRTYLFPLFVCRPTNSGMTQLAWAAGGAYYGLYYTSDKVVLEPSIGVSCEQGEDGKCIAQASEQGAIELNRSPVRAYVKNVIVASGDTVTVVTKMGAALSASGGPSITVTAGPVGITMTFPDASLSAVYAMGTYRWRCERVEQPTG